MLQREETSSKVFREHHHPRVKRSSIDAKCWDLSATLSLALSYFVRVFSLHSRQGAQAELGTGVLKQVR